MLYRRKFANLVIAVILLTSSFGIGETSTLYSRDGDDNSSFTIDLKANQEDYNTSFKYPATEVLEASLIVSASSDDEDGPEGVSLSIGAYEWKYDGSGYGGLGTQNRFISDSTSGSATFAGSGEEEIKLLLPTNATITDAQVDLSGLPYGSGELDDYNLASINTNEGSRSYEGSLSADGEDYFISWVDDGNLDTKTYGKDHLLFRGYVDGDWEDPVLLRETEVNEFITSPIIAAHSGKVVAFWILDLGSEVFEMRYSTNEGDTWSATAEQSLASDHYLLYDLDTAVDSSGTIHVAWSSIEESSEDDYQIFYSKSANNGVSWSSEIMLSGEDTSSSISPKIEHDDGKVHISWEEYDDVNGYYQAMYSTSGDNGNSFSTASKLSSTSTVSSVTVTSSGNDVLVGWTELDSTSGDAIVKSRTSSNSGSTFGSAVSASAGDDFSIGFLDSSNDGGANYYLAWNTLNYDLEYETVTVTSLNKGSSWNSPVNVGLTDSVFRASIQIATIGDDVVVTWTDGTDTSDASNDEDIHQSTSSDDGTTWSSIEAISEYYYEADSANPALSHSDDTLYICYIDDGDFDQTSNSNGNDATARDGDIIFRKSNDGGENWNTPVVISTDEFGESEIDYRSHVLDSRCDISSSSGGKVHIIWTEIDVLGYSHVYVKSSEDSGSTWSDETTIESDDGDGLKYGASIASDGNNVVAVWTNGPFGTSTNYDVYASYSTNSGQSWNQAVQISESGTQTDYMPEVAYNNGKFHIVWTDCCTNYDVLYSYSENNGATWSEQLTISGSKSQYAYQAAIAAYEDTLNVVWLDSGAYDGGSDTSRDIIGMTSTDNGNSWGEDKLIVDFTDTNIYKYPSISSGPGFTYLTYQSGDATDGYDYFFAFSQDGGGTWSDSFEITDHDSEDLVSKNNKMDTIVADKAYFAFSEESDVFGEEHKDSDIYVRTTKSDDYPTDPYVKLSGGSNDWQWNGQFDYEDSPVTWDQAEVYSSGEASRSFKDVLIDELEGSSTTHIDEYGVEMTEITFIVGSGSKGTVGFDELRIKYDLDLTVSSSKLINALNSDVDYAQNRDEDEVETTIKLNSDTDGQIILKNLEIITTNADLSVSDVSFSGTMKEGSAVSISARITNDGQGSARVDYEIRNGDNLIISGVVNGVEGGGYKDISETWYDVPAGTHDISVVIVDSTPASEGNGPLSASNSLIIDEALPEIGYVFTTNEIPVEERDNEWTLSLTNDGEKYCECITSLFVNDEDGLLLYQSDQTRINVDETRDYTSNWLPDNSVNNLYLKIEDADEGVILEESIDVSIKKLPDLSVSKIIWIDSNGDEITSFSDGTEAYPQIFIMNKGSFDVDAKIEMTITKGVKNLVDDYLGEVEPSYGAIYLPSGVESQVLIKDAMNEYTVQPSVKFISGGDIASAGFTGDWDINIKINQITATNSNEQAWDSEEMKFEDSTQSIEISSPPNLKLDSFTSSSTNINEGQAVTFTIDLENEGGAAATGFIHIKQGSTKIASTNFTIDGNSEVELKLDYSVPAGYDGELKVKAEIDRNSVYPAVGSLDIIEDDSLELTLTVKGTVVMPEAGSNSDSSGSLLVPLGAGTVVIAAAAGAFYFYRRSQISGDVEDVFGAPDMGAQQETAPAAMPQTEQPPAAAPPQPEPPAAAPPQPEPPAAAPPQPEPAAPPQPEQPPVAAPAPTLLSITVPPGVQPGQQIQIKAPDGRLVNVTIPEGLQPGSQFQVKI